MILKVKAGNHDRLWMPVYTDISNGSREPVTALREKSTGIILPSQTWKSSNGRSMLSWIMPFLKTHGEAIYQPVKVQDSGDDVVHLNEEKEGELNVTIAGELFTTYRFSSSVVKPYLYPVFAAPGVGITRNWPMVEGIPGETDDHPHHKGIYTGQGMVNGVDNWIENDGRQVHREFSKTFNGAVDGGFIAKIDWTDNSGKPNMKETRIMKFYAATKGIQLFDYSVTLHATEDRIVLGDTKEAGLLSVRVASSMDAERPDGGRITNGNGGIGEGETWGKPSAWCDYSGPIGDSWYGITLMDHPDNPRHPTPWHVRDYGLMTANCFGYHDFTGDPENRQDLIIEKGESLKWYYRVLIHSGTAEEADVSSHYINFAFPPEINLIDS